MRFEDFTDEEVTVLAAALADTEGSWGAVGGLYEAHARLTAEAGAEEVSRPSHPGEISWGEAE